ncbi:ThuA domain-containing protein [Candidatus Poribacteria bacterium]|nr:ThuA domain-containing protein [Candidatus Poribacteria bacterium]
MSKIKTLILTGANNHDWKRSTPFCQDLLEKSGKFSVTVAENPSAVLENAEELKDYQLFFSDYNGPAWSEAAKTNFEAAVRNGVGLVILHAADNAFPGWVEYEKMVGLLWRQGTGHGRFHQFKVEIVDHEHPITKGILDFNQWDELYHNLIHQHDVPYKVLAQAYSAPDTGGTGKYEPMMVVTQYGQGRIYHHVLGHIGGGQAEMQAFEPKEFQETLVRGCEWAATGKVSKE